MDDYPIDSIPEAAVEHVFTTHVKDPQNFFVHVESRTKILDDIMQNLAERYTDLGPEDKLLHNLRPGSLCAAKFTDDNNWYRAKLKAKLQGGLYEVQFVDYGNTDFVSEDRIKALDPDLVQYPVQSYLCALAGVSCPQNFWTPEANVQFEDCVMDRRCQAIFMGRRDRDEVYLVEMYDEEGNHVNQMFGAVDDMKKGQQLAQGGGEVGFKEPVLSVGTKFQATVVYVKNPGLFWCQDSHYANDIIILAENLARKHMTQDITPLAKVVPGAVCAAKFSEDNGWYRGIVQSVSRNAAKVYFVDYGNTESVSLDFVCNLKPKFREMPALALKCRLAHVESKGQQWRHEIVEKFEGLVVDKEFEAKIVGKEGDFYSISLLDIIENRDVGSQLRAVMEKYKSDAPARDINSNQQSVGIISGIGPSLTVGSKAEVFLSWVDSPGDFWVQRQDSEELLEQLSQQLQEVYSQSQPAAVPSPGAFVVARFSEDKLWYRGLVLKDFEDGQVRVLFIDYGNSDTLPSSELRQVTPAFGQVIPLAFRCSLAGVKPLRKGDKSWTGDAKDFLEKFAENGCICEVLNETESHRLVSLTAGGKDIGKELVGLRVVADSTLTESKPSGPSYSQSVWVTTFDKETVVVTHVDSLQSFWCQLCKNIPVLDDLMEKLEQHYSEDGGSPLRSPAVGRACIAQYSVDNAWYRAVITSVTHAGYDVQFVDYGNKEQVVANAVCEPEPRFLDLPIQAVHCSLPVVGELNYLASTFSEVVLDKELTMEVLDSQREVAVVELFDENMQLSEYLKGISKTSPPSKVKATALTPAKSFPAGSTVKAFTSFVTSPSKFFLQLAGSDEELGALMDRIALKYVSDNPPPALSAPQVGQPCVALYSDDNHWYRGKIISTQGNQCTVLFVDYGNEETVSKENIKVLTADLASEPVMAYQCSLSGMENSSWSASAKEFFESLVMDQELDCTFVTSTSVSLKCGGQDVSAQLQQAGHGNTRSPVSASRQAASPSSGWDETGGDTSFAASPQKGFGGGGRRDGDSRGFGDSRNNRDDSGRGFGGGRRDGDSGGFGGRQRDDDGGGFGGKSRDGGGFGGQRQRGGGDGDAGFGGGRRERKPSAESAASSGGGGAELTYADPPSDPENAILVHMDEDGTFYLQLPSMEKDILFLSKRLAGSYKDGRGPRLKESPAKGVICCAKFPEDGSMYRAMIEDVNGNSILVRYVDYGNTAECTTYDLKHLFPDLLQYPAQAFPSKLRGLNWSLDLAEKFAKATLDKDLEVTFTSTTRPYEVDIKTPDGDLLQIMTGKIVPAATKLSPKPSAFGGGKSSPGGGGLGGKSPNKAGGGFGSSGFGTSTPKKDGRRNLDFESSPPSRAPPVPRQEFLAQAAPQGENTAFISHVSDTGYFYIQLEKDTAALEGIADKLTSLPAHIKHPNPRNGSACAAVFSEDSCWYRALISSTVGSNLKVTFVDYGNGDTVVVTSIRPLTSELLAQAPLAYQCQFPDIGPLAAEAQSKMSEYLMEHQLVVVFIGSSPPFDVSITTAEGQDLQEIICPSNQYRSQPVPKEVIPAGVSHIEDDGRFFLQLYQDNKTISQLLETLCATFAKGSIAKLESPEVGMPCCVKSEDNAWHRGRITKITDGSAEILDVDTGKSLTSEVDALCSLPPEFFKKPPFALECRLKGVESWTEGLREKFTDMTQGKIMNATFYTSSPPFRVSLARSIELDLLGLAAPVPESPERKPATEAVTELSGAGDEKAYVSHVEPDATFYVQTVAREDALNNLADSLTSLLAASEPLSSAEVGQTLCAKFTEDDGWYRAKVELSDAEGQFTTRFVDYGNTDVVGTDRLTTLPESVNLQAIPPFATKCRLAGVSADLTTEQVDKLRETVTDVVLTVAYKGDEHGVQQVELFVEGASVSETLDLPVKRADEGEPAPKVGEPAYISQVEPNGAFYVQTVARESALNELADQLESLLAESEALTSISVDATACAKFTEDDAWYRARVEACDSDNQYTVRFLDYGNTDVVGLDRLTQLPESVDLAHIPAFAVKCRLDGVSADLSSDQVQKMTEVTTCEKVVNVVFKSEGADQQEAEVYIDGASLYQILGISKGKEDLNITEESNEEKDEFADAVEDIDDFVDEKMVDAQQNQVEESKPAEQEPSKDTAAAALEGETEESQEAVTESCVSGVTTGQRVAVTVSHVDSPDVLYIHLDKNKSALDELMDSMFEYFSSLPEGDGTIQGVTVGDVCAALYEDESWYRVRIESTSEDGSYTVFYIDHGNTEVTDSNSLRQLPQKFRDHSAWALKAKLGGVRPVEGDDWSDQAIEEFKNMVEEKSLLADFLEISDDGSRCVVRLLELGIPVHEEFIRKGHAVAGGEVTISKEVQRVFSDHDTSAAPKSEDFSNCLESTHLEGDDESAKSTMMSSGAHAQQKIGCVSSSLQELKEVSVFVSHSVSPSLFWCQLSSSTDTLTEISEALTEAYSSPQEDDKVTGALNAGDVVVAVFSEDQQLYRSRVLSLSEPADDQTKVAVRFIDYGNESETSRTQVYKIKDSLCKLPAQSVCCCLDKVKPVEDSWSPEACAKFSDLVTDQELSLKLVGREQDGTVLVDLVLLQSSQSVAALLTEAGYARAVGVEACIKKSIAEDTRAGDMSEMDSLEITQPIMESTAAVVDNTQNNVQTYSFEEPDEGHFRSLRLSLHTEYDVLVSNNELPNSFHIQLQELKTQYSSLMAEIAEHVISDSCTDSAEFSPKAGDACLVQHCGVWYRGEVVTQGTDSWNVKSVDCGWEVGVSQSEMKPLPSKLRDLPAQAVPCYLAGIVSVEPEWPVDAITFFIDCVKEARLCMYVLENADDGKYGVYLSDLDNTGSQSVNRAMVDVGYAEVVPGSNIEVQIDMEKTLDTDMLNELEESFNEVSILKYNAHCDTGDEASPDGVNSENPLGDTYEESELCKASKQEVDKKLYHLVEVSASVLVSEDGSRLQSDTEGTPSLKPAATSRITIKNSHFNLASAVERIDKMGCIDLTPEESLSSVEEEPEEGSSEVKSTSSDVEKSLTVSDGGDSGDQKSETAELLKSGEGDGKKLEVEEEKTPTSSPSGNKARVLYTWKQESLLSPTSADESQEKMRDQKTEVDSPTLEQTKDANKDQSLTLEHPAENVDQDSGISSEKVSADTQGNTEIPADNCGELGSDVAPSLVMEDVIEAGTDGGADNGQYARGEEQCEEREKELTVEEQFSKTQQECIEENEQPTAAEEQYTSEVEQYTAEVEQCKMDKELQEDTEQDENEKQYTDQEEGGGQDKDEVRTDIAGGMKEAPSEEDRCEEPISTESQRCEEPTSTESQQYHWDNEFGVEMLDEQRECLVTGMKDFSMENVIEESTDAGMKEEPEEETDGAEKPRMEEDAEEEKKYFAVEEVPTSLQFDYIEAPLLTGEVAAEKESVDRGQEVSSGQQEGQSQDTSVNQREAVGNGGLKQDSSSVPEKKLPCEQDEAEVVRNFTCRSQVAHKARHFETKFSEVVEELKCEKQSQEEVPELTREDEPLPYEYYEDALEIESFAQKDEAIISVHSENGDSEETYTASEMEEMSSRSYDEDPSCIDRTKGSLDHLKYELLEYQHCLDEFVTVSDNIHRTHTNIRDDVQLATTVSAEIDTSLQSEVGHTDVEMENHSFQLLESQYEKSLLDAGQEFGEARDAVEECWQILFGKDHYSDDNGGDSDDDDDDDDDGGGRSDSSDDKHGNGAERDGERNHEEEKNDVCDKTANMKVSSGDEDVYTITSSRPGELDEGEQTSTQLSPTILSTQKVTDSDMEIAKPEVDQTQGTGELIEEEKEEVTADIDTVASENNSNTETIKSENKCLADDRDENVETRTNMADVAEEVDRGLKYLRQKCAEYVEEDADAVQQVEDYSPLSCGNISTPSSVGSWKESSPEEKSAFVSCLDIDVSELDASELTEEGAEGREQLCGEGVSTVADDDVVDSRFGSAAQETNVESEGGVEEGNQAGSICSTDSVVGTLSLDTTVDEYESCSELAPEDEERDFLDAEGNSYFAESSIDSHRPGDDVGESSYDTSSLVFSDSHFDSLVDTTGFGFTSGAESTLESGTSYLESSANTLDTTTSTQDTSTSRSSHSTSTCHSASNVTTASASEGDQDTERRIDLTNGNLHTTTDESISDLDLLDFSGLNFSGSEPPTAEGSPEPGGAQAAVPCENHNHVGEESPPDVSDLSGEGDVLNPQAVGHLQNPEDDGHLQNPEDDGHLQNPEDDGHLLYQQNDEYVLYPEDGGYLLNSQDNGHLQNPQDDEHVLIPEDGGYLLNPQDNGHLLNPQDDEHVLYPEDGGYLLNPQDDGHLLNPQDEGLVLNPQDEGLVLNPQDEGLVLNPQDEGLVLNPQDEEDKATMTATTISTSRESGDGGACTLTAVTLEQEAETENTEEIGPEIVTDVHQGMEELKIRIVVAVPTPQLQALPQVSLQENVQNFASVDVTDVTTETQEESSAATAGSQNFDEREETGEWSTEDVKGITEVRSHCEEDGGDEVWQTERPVPSQYLEPKLGQKPTSPTLKTEIENENDDDDGAEDSDPPSFHEDTTDAGQDPTLEDTTKGHDVDATGDAAVDKVDLNKSREIEDGENKENENSDAEGDKEESETEA